MPFPRSSHDDGCPSVTHSQPDPGTDTGGAPVPTRGRGRRLIWWTIAKRTIALVIAAVVIYTLLPLLVNVMSTASDLKDIAPAWFAVMVLFEAGSFFAAWGLTRLAVNGLTWRTASMAQLASNSAAKVLPGGAVIASALYYRMLSRSGVSPGAAAAALTVNSLISTMVLFALPLIAVIIAAFSAPVPAGLAPVAIGGVIVFVALGLLGILAIRFDAPLRWATRIITAVRFRWAALRHPHSEPAPDHSAAVLARRDEVVGLLGKRWIGAVGFAAMNWLMDYLALVAALYAIGARPRLSIVLLAYAASAVLTMIPITPGGLGFVEAGLAAALTVAGVVASRALLATLAYRLVAFWLPIPVGGIAYLIFRRRHRLDPSGPVPAT